MTYVASSFVTTCDLSILSLLSDIVQIGRGKLLQFSFQSPPDAGLLLQEEHETVMGSLR